MCETAIVKNLLFLCRFISKRDIHVQILAQPSDFYQHFLNNWIWMILLIRINNFIKAIKLHTYLWSHLSYLILKECMNERKMLPFGVKWERVVFIVNSEWLQLLVGLYWVWSFYCILRWSWFWRLHRCITTMILSTLPLQS